MVVDGRRFVEQVDDGQMHVDRIHLTAHDLLRASTNLTWWARNEINGWLQLLGPGQIVTGAQRARERFNALLKTLIQMRGSLPGSIELEVYEEEGFRAKFKLRGTNEKAKLRITGPDFDPAYTWPLWQ